MSDRTIEDGAVATALATERAEPPAERDRRARALATFLRGRIVADYGPILLLLIVVAWLCLAFYERGHDWGDDFALYIHQAKGLVNGNVGEVVATNRYAIDNSGWSSFSPVTYPWGFPMMLAPVVALWGVDYAKLKLVVILAFLGYVFCLYRIVLPRAGRVPAALVAGLVGASVIFVGWTSSVISDFPYLLVAGITLLWIDRCRTRGRFEGDGLRDLVILGLLMAFAFNVRREGAALVLALLATQLVTVAPRLRDLALGAGRDGPPPSIRWRRLAVPYTTALGAVVALQLVLPSQLNPHYRGAGLAQIKPNVIWFRDVLAEQIGMKDIGVSRIALFGQWRLAAIVIGAFLVLAVVGMLARLLHATAQDVSLVAYMLAVAYIVGTQPFHESRYMLGITPFLAYFAYQALPTIAKIAGVLTRPAVVVSCVLFGGLVLANATDMPNAVRYHLNDHSIINGPTLPASEEMIAEVDRCTRGDDVVAFFRARAMSMLTDRKSIQTGSIDQILRRADWYMMEKFSDYSQPPVSDTDAARLHLRKVWENSDWVLWLVPGGRAVNRRLDC